MIQENMLLPSPCGPCELGGQGSILVRFLVRARARVAGLVPSGGDAGGSWSIIHSHH